MTRYVVWRPDHYQTREDGREFDARSPQAACEKWAVLEDTRSDSYPFARGNIAEVMVADVNSSLPPSRYIVSGESVTIYRVQMVHGKPPIREDA